MKEPNWENRLIRRGISLLANPFVFIVLLFIIASGAFVVSNQSPQPVPIIGQWKSYNNYILIFDDGGTLYVDTPYYTSTGTWIKNENIYHVSIDVPNMGILRTTATVSENILTIDSPDGAVRYYKN